MSEKVANNGGSQWVRKEIFGVVDREGHERGFWTKIGVAFENRDGSWSLKFDYFPARPEVKLHLRDPYEPRDNPSGAR